MMTNAEVKGLLGIEFDALNAIWLDSEYSLASREWILGTWSAGFRSTLWSLHADKYQPEKNDCDKYAFLCMSLARLANNRSNPENRSLAIGVLLYERDSGGGHAINVAIVKNAEGKREVMYYEPQTQQEVKLSETELNNVDSVII